MYVVLFEEYDYFIKYCILWQVAGLYASCKLPICIIEKQKNSFSAFLNPTPTPKDSKHVQIYNFWLW
jgi:hypothetical protein